MLTLPNGVIFRHMYSVFALESFVPLLPKASPHCSRSTSLAHSTTSSANIICQGASFVMFSVSESTMMANKKGLKEDRWFGPTFTRKRPASSCTTPHYCFALMVHVLLQYDYTSMAPSLSIMHQCSSPLVTVSCTLSRLAVRSLAFASRSR